MKNSVKLFLIWIISSALFLNTSCNKEESPEPDTEHVLPDVSGVTPEKGVPGTRITISGNNFENDDKNIKITVDGATISPMSITDSFIEMEAPAHKPGTAEVKVFLDNQVIKSTAFVYRYPEIETVDPTEADQGTEIILLGSDFTAYPDLKVYFDQLEAQIVRTTKDSLIVIVPDHENGKAKISLKVMDVPSTAAIDFMYTEPISTSFVDSTSGWTVWGDAGDVNLVPEYSPDGGVQNGYIYAIDKVLGGVWYFVAPDNFLGDRSDAYGKELSFSLKQSGLQSQFENQENPDIILGGADFNVVYDTENHPDTVWTDYKVKIVAGDRWTINTMDGKVATEAEIKEVLADLKSFKIRGEFITGDDIGSLDNPYFPGVN